MIALKNGVDSNPAKMKALNTAAIELLNRLQNENSKVREIIINADNLSNAYIELALLNPPAKYRTSKSTIPIPIDKKSKLGRVFNLAIPILTTDQPVSTTYDHPSIVTIHKFQQEYYLVGGINAPKVIQCIGSDGNIYTQLVKGGSDDLRQDATLSNVFIIMNLLLKKNFETRTRNLKIETYKIIPLGQRAGVLEWVDHTIPFGEYLADAHNRYHKTDLSSLDARKKMMTEHEKDDSSPNSKDPAMWFHSRMLYTRSTGVISILGWVVGLGDRHPQNTLIDQNTGAIIQIDLGIAFDQGKLLSTPELVPFRLTRDVVDAMGSMGIEGGFRRCCEETLKVARKEANIIYTILDVFRYDPLYNWKGVQSRVRDGKNIEAERALVGVRKKLSDSLSIECQINELLICAMDKSNLSKMYPGW
ncbi:hypothetical protein HK100_000616 [Physocladia obscura]|uniref:Serine/threonine-protein kinase TEL1 n=1 Tax=Physocladia obscura TaxID=109957 RepID=A0AAD5SYD1_9FUNG|nr:hypothetical protein HK100_000616 [Physocladia obscura]